MLGLIAAAAIALTGAFALMLRSYLAERSDFIRHRSEWSLHPERLGVPGLQEVTVSPPDEPRLAGWYAPAANRAAVILVHGTHSDRASLIAETRLLVQAGFGALAIDLPGQGASDGRTLWGVAERRAISAAVDWLAARPEVDAGRIGGFGLSMGAYVLTQAAVLDPRLQAVVLAASPNDVVEQNWVTSARWGPLTQWPTYWALRASGMPLDMLPKDVIGGIAPRAVFILNGERDRTVPPYMARQLFASAGEPKELWMIPDAGHGNYADVIPGQYGGRLTDFYRRRLLT